MISSVRHKITGHEMTAKQNTETMYNVMGDNIITVVMMS